jgi:2-keto-myo-inositol isomerase
LNPNPFPLTRRTLLKGGLAAAGLSGLTGALPVEARTEKKHPFRYCLNTSTIRGQKLPIAEVIAIAAKAGYDGIEPWIDELDRHVKGGGTLADLRKRISDHGLTVESGIGFPQWIVDDEATRKKALEQAKREMEMIAAIGGARIAAPAAGATDIEGFNLTHAAERYRALLEVGDQTGVVPMVEVWGFSKTLQRLGEAVHVAIGANHPKACILADIYHLYKGGSGIEGLRLLSAGSMHVIHVNDYPGAPPPATITDAHRVYPGDGIAPVGEVVRILKQIGFDGALSLELFNETYYKQDALQVAKTGLEKTKAAVHAALG